MTLKIAQKILPRKLLPRKPLPRKLLPRKLQGFSRKGFSTAKIVKDSSVENPPQKTPPQKTPLPRKPLLENPGFSREGFSTAKITLKIAQNIRYTWEILGYQHCTQPVQRNISSPQRIAHGETQVCVLQKRQRVDTVKLGLDTEYKQNHCCLG